MGLPRAQILRSVSWLNEKPMGLVAYTLSFGVTFVMKDLNIGDSVVAFGTSVEDTVVFFHVDEVMAIEHIPAASVKGDRLRWAAASASPEQGA